MRVPQFTHVEVRGRKLALSFHPVSKGIEIRVLDLAVGGFTCSAILLAPDACMPGKLTLPVSYNHSPPGDFIA